ARNLGVLPQDVRTMLSRLKEIELLDYEPSRDTPSLCFLIAREHPLHYDQKEVKTRKEAALNRVKAVFAYAKPETECRSRNLLKYFDEEDAPKCGVCDVCLEEKKQEYPESFYREEIEKMLKADIRELKQMIFHMGYWHEQGIQLGLQHLLDEGMISLNDKQELAWNGN